MRTSPGFCFRSIRSWSLGLLCAGVAVVGVVSSGSTPEVVAADPPAAIPVSSSDASAFKTWPKDRKPEYVLVLTGQMYGYLQKCGCSDPQKGGLERRWVYLDGLRKSGMDVIPLDLGDVSRESPLKSQTILKYRVAMESLKSMGYRGIGLGKNEFTLPLLDGLAEFTLQPGNESPAILTNNIANAESLFPSLRGEGSCVQATELIVTKSGRSIGVTALVGNDLQAEALKADDKLKFAEGPKAVAAAIEELGTKAAKLGTKPELNVFLYQGDLAGARALAGMYPQFDIVVCRSEEAEPPMAPDYVTHKKGEDVVGRTMILRVGHKGQHIGRVGVFRSEKGRAELFYEKVSIDPIYDTVKGQEAANPVLVGLEKYAIEVKKKGLVSQFPKTLHPTQADLKNAFYVGSDKCQSCHVAEHKQWSDTKHSHAFEALAKIATRPSNRQFDGECIICHTVGYSYNTGYDGTADTTHLRDVGCEVCHGPGSLHSAKGDDATLYKYLSPWKRQPTDKLPEMKKILAAGAETDPEKRNGLFTAAEKSVLLRVDAACQKCHDTDNDPHFVFEKYWPKTGHSGLKQPK